MWRNFVVGVIVIATACRAGITESGGPAHIIDGGVIYCVLKITSIKFIASTGAPAAAVLWYAEKSMMLREGEEN